MRCRVATIADRPPENLGPARGRKDQLHQQLQRRRLAGAVRAEEAEDLARLDRRATAGRARGTAACARSRSRSPWSAPRCAIAGGMSLSSGNGPRLLGPLQLQLRCRTSKYCGGRICVGIRPLMKNVGVDFTPSSWPSPASVLISSLRACVLRVEVGDAADRPRRVLDLRRASAPADRCARRSTPPAYRTYPSPAP